MEVCYWRKDDEAALKEICAQLETGFLMVDDRIGLVKAVGRACDHQRSILLHLRRNSNQGRCRPCDEIGFKLPVRTFRMEHRIGVKHVYELVEAVYEDARDERYKFGSKNI